MPDFTMPSLGADMEFGTLLEWLVKPGDVVHRGDPVAVVDTDKAAIEVESFHDGVVGDLLVEPGTRLPVGAPMARIDGAAAGEAPAVAAVPGPPVPGPPGPGPAVPELPVPVSAVAAVVAGAHQAPVRVRATPPVRHHAAELGVDLDAVTGSGAHGAVTRADVDRVAAARAARPRVSPYARRLAAERGLDVSELGSAGTPVLGADVLAATPAAPAAPAAHRPGRGAVAALMSRSKREIPHYYVATTVDLGPVTEWLRRTNRTRPVTERVVPAAAILRATAVGLHEMPSLNGFWVDDAFVPGEDVHLGVAVSVREGALVAPAIHAAADLSLIELMAALRDLVSRARKGRLTRAEMADPTFTVTDLGDQGVEEVIGVIYPPQVALLGVGRIVERPWAVDGLLGVRPVVRLTLSGDHRATDGVTGARFLATVDRLLQHPEEL